jgi:hypothetical protein
MAHLRAMPNVEPTTGTGRVAWMWPEIEAALSSGNKLREVWNAARSDGLEIPYPQFRAYVSRIRIRRSRKQASVRELTSTAPPGSDALASPDRPVERDPFRNLRDLREKSRTKGFEYDPFSIRKQLID